MSRLPTLLLAFAVLLPASADARAEIRVASGPLISLTAPTADTELAAGTPAVLAWKPVAGAELDELDEWEAFLSLDGGTTYPLRITPQLDLKMRQVLWHVPSLASDDARLLFHLGGRDADGERFEIAVELPHKLRIAPPRSTLILPPRYVLGRGQVARPGEPGVVGWVEGSRHGEGLHEMLAIDSRSHVVAYEPPELGDVMAEIQTEPLPSFNVSVTVATGRVPPPPPLARVDSRRGAPLACREILLQSSRLNE